MTSLLEPPVTETLPVDPDVLDPDAVLDPDGDGTGPDDVVDETVQVPAGRASLGVALSTLAASVMVGGVFLGVQARFITALTAIAGVALAFFARRIKGAALANLALLAGIGVIGLLAMLPNGGLSAITSVGAEVAQAAKDGDILRPPVEFTPGWNAIVGWLLAAVGMAAGWTAMVLNKPTAGLLIPLPLAVIAGISVPKDQQVTSGIVVVALFAAALGVVATGQLVGEDDERPSVAFQVRRALRSILVIGVLTVILAGASTQGFLFPKPTFNPASTAQLPKTVPPTNAPDRVLFTVKSQSTGPYRVGVLDVYDGEAWRFAPVAEAGLVDVPSSGVILPNTTTGVAADITIAGYSGSAVLPSTYRLIGVVAQGPKFSYDKRSDTVRVAQGQLIAGFQYQIASASLPKIDQLQAVTAGVPKDQQPFLEAPPIPARLQPVLADLKRSNNWDTFIALRQRVLSSVVANGAGIPKPVPPARVEQLLLGDDKQGSPYEATAAIALLSRWAGIPSRIGFGFQADPTAKDPQGAYTVRPKDAISYPEVYFDGYGWLPVTGLPEKAKANSSNTNSTKNKDVKPSDDFGVSLVLPEQTPPPSRLAQTLLVILLSAAALALVVYLGYLITPAIRKVLIRSRRRARARELGPRAQIALAYAEFRDADSDLGYGFEADTPLAHLSRFAEDAEHKELAWLVTRALWGDLRDDVTPAMAAHAEELSRALRSRLNSAHPATLRFLAIFSRASLKGPYAPELVAWLAEKPQKEGQRDLVIAPAPS